MVVRANRAVDLAVFHAVSGDVGWAVNGTVGLVVWDTVYQAVVGDLHWAVYGAVDEAVEVAVGNARAGDPPHPALKDYLGEAR